jgi:3-oxoacyl-(acyl-carrier-protein) synthase
MSQRRVAITGLGLVSPYGGDLADFFSRLCAGESAVRYLLTDDKPRPLSIPFVNCLNFNPDTVLGKPLASMMDRFAQLGMAAAFSAWDDAGFPARLRTIRAMTGVCRGAQPSAARWLMKKAIRTVAERPRTTVTTLGGPRHE